MVTSNSDKSHVLAFALIISASFVNVAFGAGSSPNATSVAPVQPTAFSDTEPQLGAPTGVMAPLPALQEVIVTAQKFASPLQKTPVAITVVTQAQLVNSGVNMLSSIQKVAPDVNITYMSSGPTISIRGLSTTQSNSPGQDGVVAMYFDGAFIQPNVMEGMLFDLNRVEVDKGPQTTLYGKDAVAGAIDIVPNWPILGKKGGDAQLEFGSYDTLRMEAAVNLPIGSTFALRFAGQTYSHHGYMESGLDDANLQSGRVSALWKPNDDERLVIVGDYSTDNARTGEATVNIVQVEPGITGIYVPSNPRNDVFYNGAVNGPNSPWYFHTSLKGVTVQNDFDLGFATWTTIAAYRRYSDSWVYPFPTDIGQGPDAVAPNGGTYPTGGKAYTPQRNRQESVETRLVSNSRGPLHWVVGLYGYWDTVSGTMNIFGSSTATVPSLQIANPYNFTSASAVYGQVIYTPSFMPALHLTVAGRWEEDRAQQRNTFTQFGPFIGSEIPQTVRSWAHGTYHIGISYDLTQHSMLYVDTATAFRAGGLSYGVGQNPQEGPVSPPEYVKAYEGGIKNRFLDQRLQVNLSGWVYNYTNIANVLMFFQCSAGCGGLPAITTGNAGEAKYWGAATDIDYLITDNDELHFAGSWMNAQYGKYVQQVAPGYSLAPGPVAITSNPFLSNTNIPYVPRVSAIASYAHTVRNIWDGGSITARISAQFQSSQILDRQDDPVYGVVQFRSPSWAMGDVSVTYKSNGIWSVQAYCHNFTNKLVPDYGTYSTTTHTLAEAFYPPRVFGAVIEARF